MRRKILALQLIESIIEVAGPMLQKNERFVNNAIKKYLFVSLLRNGLSPFIKVFRTTLSIFLGLLSKFQVNLRNEIGVYFSKIILHILASSNSSIQHKHVVLRLLLKICKDAQILVDIFLNFDCHMDSADIFEKIVTELSGIAKGTYIPSGAPLTQQEASVRLLGLECLVTIMKSLVHWSSDLTALQEETLEDSSSKSIETENSDIKLTSSLPSTTTTTNNTNTNTPTTITNNTNTTTTNNNESISVPSNLDKFTQQKHWKQQVEHGKKLFNYKPKKGIAFLTEIGHIPNTSKGVAQFLLHTEGLDREKIGDYIGDISNQFSKTVLYDYIDIQRFNDMEIYAALRKFLLGFRLPGEGQKIDVIMEKFAERYYTDNKKDSDDFLFANADAVYIFAYHMIMLATDLHSHAIKKKITKSEWIKNNTGLNDGKDFSEKFLLDIYDSVTAHRLRVRDDDSTSRYTNAEFLSSKQRQMLFHKESENIVQRSQELIQDQLQKKTIFFKSTNIQHVKPMFATCWCPLLAALSMNLENSQDSDREVYTLCLDGFQSGIRVSSIFFMETERNAFVSSLSQFTLLSNLREMKQKNIEAIKCLIQIANTDGNYLQDSWKEVLKCISQLAKIHILGTTKISNSSEFTHYQSQNVIEGGANGGANGGASGTSRDNPNNPHTEGLRNNTRRQDSSGAITIKNFENINATSVAEQINVDEIDKIFSNTVHLNDNAIVFFVKCLCYVSNDEVDSINEPRTFSLQKLIEIAYYNMTRIRFVWTRIWGIMADHFKKVGLHTNKKISMYAVDSLRQLAMKFLEKDELANYHFQKDFLKPFEYIISSNRSLVVRELVVRCLTQMILARGENIKSGWKSIFIVFTFAGNESDQSIVSLAFDITQKILDDYFHLISSGFFVECVNCIVAFAKNKNLKEIGCKAVEALAICANHLANGDVFDFNSNNEQKQQKEDIIKNESNENDQLHDDNDKDSLQIQTKSSIEEKITKLPNEEFDFIFSDNEHDIKFWFPILTGLSEVISHPHVDVRKNALDTLFEILFEYGNLMSPGLWELIFRGVLFPIFDNVRHAGDGSWLKEDNEWLTSTCLNALSLFVKIFSHFFNRVNFLLDDCLALLTSCILQENQHLASIGTTCLLQLVMLNGMKWTDNMWTRICFTIQYIITCNRSVELLSLVGPSSSSSSSTTTNNNKKRSGTTSTPQNQSKSLENENNNEPSSLDNKTISNEEKQDQEEEKKENTTSQSDSMNENNENNNLENANKTAVDKHPSSSLEQKLIQATPPKYFPYDIHVITGKSNVLLQLLETTKDILVTHLHILQISHINTILKTLQEAYEFAFYVNNTKEVWRATAKSSIMQLVIRHESLSVSILLEILFSLYSSEHQDRVVFAENTLINIIVKLLSDYMKLNSTTPSSYSTSKVPIMLQTIVGVETLSNEQVCFFNYYFFPAFSFILFFFF